MRTLEETREKLAAYPSSDEDSMARFDEVMKALETFAKPTVVGNSVAPRNF